jgi:hypothetical protein
MQVNLNTGQLDMDMSGACKIQMTANVTGDAKLRGSGASKLQGELNAQNVKFDFSGANSVLLTGSAKEVKIDATGSTKINAGDFTVKTAVIETSGSGNIIINATDVLEVNSAGASSVSYKGSPAVTINSAGASKVRKI